MNNCAPTVSVLLPAVTAPANQMKTVLPANRIACANHLNSVYQAPAQTHAATSYAISGKNAAHALETVPVEILSSASETSARHFVATASAKEKLEKIALPA